MEHGLADEAALLRRLFQAALDAADPRLVVPPALPEKPSGRCVVVGAGKAAALMAQIVDQCWPDVRLSGVVVTRYGHAVPAGRITVLQAGHPVPDAASEAAARAILAAVHGLTPGDLVLALISGGGSAVMALPEDGVTLGEKQALTAQLLLAGATIAEINTVRRHLSAIKGGKLAAAAAPARVVTLAISDVPGDDPAIIASGPTVPMWSGETELAEIAARYALRLPPLRASAHRGGGGGLAAVDYRLVATPCMALAAAAALAGRAGIAPLILGDALEGEARETGKVLAGIALGAQRHGTPLPAPCVLLSGGETTVTIGPGKAGSGGRNTEFLLALACQLSGAPGIWALACDTDGIDGTSDIAGALMEPGSLRRARAAGLNPAAALRAHDSYSVFAASNGLIVTGPTLTNVNDFRAILIKPA